MTPNQGRGLNLAIKRDKPNTGGPSLIAGPKTQEEVALKKTEKKLRNKNQVDQPETSTKQTAPAISTPDKDGQSRSTPKMKQKAKLKMIDLTTRPEDFLDTFQNRNLAPADWENLVDQLLKNGVQKVADELRGQSQPADERDEKFEPPPGASDDSSVEEARVRRSSRQTKSKEPKRFRDPVKHFITEVSEE